MISDMPIDEFPFGSELTAIDIRHMAHSDECMDDVSESFLASVLPRARMRLCVVMLLRGQYFIPRFGEATHT